jgi:hypothetical protein
VGEEKGFRVQGSGFRVQVVRQMIESSSGKDAGKTVWGLLLDYGIRIEIHSVRLK